jgi:glycosyltransferase involved in cell wall biosynthesis
MAKVKVTVLMPAFNASEYIAEAIDSVLTQTFTGFELLIIDDGSTDNTVSIIQQFSDSRIRLLLQPRLGIGIALNLGLLNANGYYIARFDADDICFPERLQKQVSFLDSNPGYVLTGCDAEYIAESGEHLFNFHCIGHTHDEIKKQLHVYCPFIHSSVMCRKEAVLEAGSYPIDAHNFEDYLLWIKLTKYGSYHNLPEQLIKVRFNPNSATIDEKWRGRRFRQLKKNIIHRGAVTKEEGDELLAIIKNQDVQKIKEGAYYALCGKKFLVDNHQPAKARTHIAKAIYHYPFRLDNYALYMLSFFPQPFIHWLHRKT